MNSLNIAFFITSLDSGGIENYLLRFLREKYSCFSNIYIYCKSGRGGQLEAEYAEFDNVHIVKSKISYFSFHRVRELSVFFIRNNISIVCDFTGNFSGFVLYAAHKARVEKRVAFYRGASDHFNKNALRNVYNNIVKLFVTKYATNILSNSKAALDYFFYNNWKSDSRFAIIYNGVNASFLLTEKENLRKEFGIPDTAFVIGHTGRYDKAKNHKTIIAVAERLVSKYQNVYFILCGNGVKSNLIDYLVINSLDHRILVFENRMDIPKFLNTMDCYFFPSVTEGQPNALIEAMVMGLPYISSNIDPIKETTLNLDYLYNPYDVESFLNALNEIYLSRPERNVEAQQLAINKFDSGRCFNEFYERLVI